MNDLENFGIDKGKIRGIQLELKVLREQGLLVDLDIRGTGMFARSANWSDIGIAENVEDPRYHRLTTGQKYLIPDEQIKKLKSIETRMRQWLDKLTYDVHGFAPYRWLPYTAYPKWREKWTELLADFETVKAEIIENHDQYLEETMTSFREVAEASWQAITAPGYQWVVKAGEAYDHDMFVEKVVLDAVVNFPSVEEIQQRLTADYSPALVYGSADFAEDQAKAQAIKDQQAIEHAAAQAKIDEEYVQVRILQEDLAHKRELNDIEADKKRRECQAMIEAEAEHIRQRLQQEVSPYEEVFKALRGRFAQSAASMLESIKKNGHVRGKIAEQGSGLIELFDLMAVHDDSELRGKLARLKTAINQVDNDGAPARSTEQVKEILGEIQELAEKAGDDLLAGPSRFSMLDL